MFIEQLSYRDYTNHETVSDYILSTILCLRSYVFWYEKSKYKGLRSRVYRPGTIKLWLIGRRIINGWGSGSCSRNGGPEYTYA
jgi:hypothetical protein